MLIERPFPLSIEQGDILVSIWQIVAIEGYTTGATAPGDPADAYKVFFANSSNADPAREFPGTIVMNSFRFDVPTDAENWPPGSFDWWIRGEWTRGGVRRQLVFSRGIVQVLLTGESRSADIAFAEVMIVKLKEIIQHKADGTADLGAYTIGGRSTSLMSFGELQKSLKRFQNDVARLKGGWPHFDSGTEGV